jgi:hypothetical protein
MQVTTNPVKALDFQRELSIKAIKQTNVKNVSEVQKINTADLKLTPIEISNALKRLRISLLDENLLGRFIDGFA